MDISRTSDAARSAPLRSDTFTGDVWGEPLIGRPPDIVVNHVLFSPAARTGTGTKAARSSTSRRDAAVCAPVAARSRR